MDFVHLHAHTTYSILDGWGTPAQVAERLGDIGASFHAVTDHDSISGHWKVRKEFDKAGVTPLYGIEIRVIDDLEQRAWRSPEGKRFYPYHLGIIARTNEGYKNLVRLTSLAWRQGMGGRGMYMPVVTWDDIREHQAGLMGTSGCLSGKVSRAILGEIEDDWREVLTMIEGCFEPGMLFPEWQNVDLDACRLVASKLAKLPNAVMTHDVHFPEIDKREGQNIMAAVRRWKKVTGPDGQGPMQPQCYIATDKEAWKIQQELGEVEKKYVKRAFDNTLKAASLADVTLPQIDMVRFPLPEGVDDSLEFFKDMIREGWKKRGLHKRAKQERERYRQRVRYEMDIIVQKDFVDYFLIVADICKFCVRQDILKGPARGSSAGSLVAWLCEITEVDPLAHGLIFERFIDLNRHDLPDIDMDFPDDRREEIHEHLAQQYGEDRIGYIGTFTKYKAKNSLDDVARVFELPYWVPNKIKNYIPERAHGDVRSDMTLADTWTTFDEVVEIVEQYPEIRKAELLEGQFRGMGVHPAGFVVSSEPIEDVAPIYEQPDKGRVVGLDLYDAAEAGLLKLDLLGLSTMTVLQRARDAVRLNHGVDIDFYTLPLDDEPTLQGFRDVDVLGIFQFSGKATKNTLRQVAPHKFAVLADINTLSRPGSMLAGTSDQYMSIHNGRLKPESIHPIVDAITEDTHRLVLYQEQVLHIMREFGGLDWQTSSEIRKMMSKRMGMEILQQFWEQFREGALSKGIDEQTAWDVWMKTSTFGAYGFNKSHSVSYAMIAYWQMYVKVHYPTEFYYAALAVEGDDDKRNLFVNEAKRKGVAFLPVDPNRSGLVFTLEEEGIRYGLTQVKGIGEKTAQLIIDARPITAREDLLAIRGIGERTADLFDEALNAGDDLFGLEQRNQRIVDKREEEGAISVMRLREMADELGHTDEHVVAGLVISRNYRQEEKLSVQAKSADKVGARSDTVIVYIRDESGESMPVVIPGWLGTKKTKEIWEAEDDDIYLIRGKLAGHGKFFLANGLANTGHQDRRNGHGAKAATEPSQLSLL